MKEPKLKTVYVCSNCGETSPRWMGRCPSCGSWNTMNEDVVAEAPKAGLTGGKAAAPARQEGVALWDGQRIGQSPAGELQFGGDLLGRGFTHQHIVHGDRRFLINGVVEAILAGLGLGIEGDVDSFQHKSSRGLRAPMRLPTPSSFFSSLERYSSPAEPPLMVQLWL